MLEKKVLPEDSRLAVDYESVSKVVPPAKKATSAHTVSSLFINVSFFTGFWSSYGRVSEKKMAIFYPKMIFPLFVFCNCHETNDKIQKYNFTPFLQKVFCIFIKKFIKNLYRIKFSTTNTTVIYK